MRRLLWAAGPSLAVFGCISGAHAQTFVWTGAANNIWDTSSANWVGTGPLWVNSAASDALFNFDNGGSQIVFLGQDITANSINLTAGGYSILGNDFGITLAGPGSEISSSIGGVIGVPIRGSVGLTKNGSGLLRLVDACTYTGATGINGGVLELGIVHNVLPTSTDLHIAGGASLELIDRSQQVAALTGGGVVTNSTLAAAGSNFTVGGSAGGATFTGEIKSRGALLLPLFKVGTGTQTLGGTAGNVYFGGTTISGGTLIAAKTDALGGGSVSVAGTLGLQGGCTLGNVVSLQGPPAAGRGGVILNVSGNNAITGICSVLNSTMSIGADSGTLTLSELRSTTLNATITFNCAAGSHITAPLRTTFTIPQLIKNGGGSLAISEPNGVFGTLTINEGSVVFGNAAVLSLSGVAMHASQPTLLRMNGFSPTIQGPEGGGPSAAVDNAGSPMSSVLTIHADGPSARVFEGTLMDGGSSGGLGVTKRGNAVQVFTAGQTYTGQTSVNQGTLRLQGVLFSSPVVIGGGTLDGNGDIGRTVTLNSGVLSGSRTIDGRLTVNGGTVRPGSGVGTMVLNDGLDVTAGTIQATGDFSCSLNMTMSGASVVDTGTFNATLTGALTGTGSLTKVGTGSLTVTNVATSFGGGSTINAGTLVNNGALPGPVTINTGGSLAGTGGVGPVVVNGGILSPGNPGATGRITCTGGVTFGSGGCRFDIAGPTPDSQHDRLRVSGGDVSLGEGSATLQFGTLAGAFAATDRLYIINNFGTGALTGWFAGLPDNGSAGTVVPQLNGFGGKAHWRIHYHASFDTGSLSGGNDVALAPANACTADFNNSGSISVQDIFDFLTAYFASSSAADINDSGDVSVQDIFDFLAAFFAVCP